MRDTSIITKRIAWLAAAVFVVGCSTAPPPAEQVASAPSLVGPAGFQGPAGPAGPQGPVGATGAPGYVASGARGITGMAGPAGVQGPVGATGAQGTSMVGAAGPSGAVGPAGAQGVAGGEGSRGPTLVGPVGSIGSSGVAGVQGASGQMGNRGDVTVGNAGEAGPSGAAGAQGPMGATGAQGPAGIVGHWTKYREFTFNADQAALQPSDMTMVNEIAGYMAQNPSLHIGIDGFTNPDGGAPNNQSLNNRRVEAVQNALITAGVPASKIQEGAFGNPQLRRDGRVEVLIATGGSPTA
jgi:outer membrane protein OmpA-like peptidoglycan-associated protein